MRLSRLLVAAGVAAIPLWYAYRTVEDKRVRRLEWREVFMTEHARQKKWAEEREKAKEAAEAERVKAATELAQATAARKAAEAEAAKAAADLVQKKTQAEAEAARQRLEAERAATQIATARLRVETERAALQEALRARLKRCQDKTKVVENEFGELLAEHKRYVIALEEMAAVQLPRDSPVTFVQFTATFRNLDRDRRFHVPDNQEIAKTKDACEAIATNHTDERSYELNYAVQAIERLGDQYTSQTGTLKRLQSDLRDLVDFAIRKLPDTVGGQVKRARVQDAISRSIGYRD